jgi:CRISPR/Cas system CMR subunit Cmr6 (Cas7 group RAMP superfamily)
MYFHFACETPILPVNASHAHSRSKHHVTLRYLHNIFLKLLSITRAKQSTLLEVSNEKQSQSHLVQITVNRTMLQCMLISQNTPNRHAISQSLVIQTHAVINIPSIPAAALRGVWRKQYVNFDVSQTIKNLIIHTTIEWSILSQSASCLDGLVTSPSVICY